MQSAMKPGWRHKRVPDTKVMGKALDKGAADHHISLWRILLPEEWHRRYIDDASGLVHGFAA